MTASDPTRRFSDDSAEVDTELVAAGTPIDLDNCAREPIHIPGSIQPRGVLLVVRESDFVVSQLSANVMELLGVAVEDALMHPLPDVIGPGPAQILQRAAQSFGDLRERNPHEVDVLVDGTLRTFDAILHRQDEGLLLIELEVAYGPRPFSFPNTYQAVRGAVAELNRALSLTELYDITAQAVRNLTGFDRVMVYRYDRDYNGEVVAEAKRDDLNSFLGLHYPASDIPAQARALYEKNWIRLIDDVGYTPSPLVPPVDPASGRFLDLTHATLRSVSPIHIEYLHNMGVGASMSISLLRNGRLWGLIACHHYSGAHLPPYGTRAAAEFLGATLSLRLVDRSDDDEYENHVARQNVLAKLTAATLNESDTLIRALLGAPDLLDLISASGVAVSVGDRYETRGEVPDEDVVQAVVAWASATGDDIAYTDDLFTTIAGLDVSPDAASGALILVLPDGQFAAWFRGEVLREVDWGGDPHNKAIAVQEDDGVRLSPRKSFARWREVVRQRSAPWSTGEQDSAAQLRRHLVEALYQRTRSDLRMAETLQRSLLPDALPHLTGWELSARYEPAEGGRIGGDWYDAFTLREGRLALVLGDVAGHGIAAAGTMAQLRNALRAHLFDGASPDDALRRVNNFALTLLPGVFATTVLACVDLTTGAVDVASAGNPVPFVVAAEGDASSAPVIGSPPLGVPGVTYRRASFDLAPGASLVVFSDGLIERREESIDVGLGRLRDSLQELGRPDAQSIWAARARGGDDDVTVLVLRRDA